MSRIGIESLGEGDELGPDEIPQCCDALMDRYPGGFQCGRCDSFVTVNRDRTITCVEIV